MEVLVVIGIFSIMLSMLSYSYTRYVNNTNLRTAARQISADIGYMKQEASTNFTSNCTMTFNKTANTYTMLAANVFPQGASTVNTSLTTITTIRSLDAFGNGITFYSFPNSNATYTLTFASRGTLSSGGTIVVKNNRQSAANVIYNITGKTYVTYDMR